MGRLMRRSFESLTHVVMYESFLCRLVDQWNILNIRKRFARAHSAR